MNFGFSPFRFCSIRKTYEYEFSYVRNASVDWAQCVGFHCGWRVNAIPIERKIPRKKKTRAKQRKNKSEMLFPCANINYFCFVFFFFFSFDCWMVEKKTGSQSHKLFEKKFHAVIKGEKIECNGYQPHRPQNKLANAWKMLREFPSPPWLIHFNQISIDFPNGDFNFGWIANKSSSSPI